MKKIFLLFLITFASFSYSQNVESISEEHNFKYATYESKDLMWIKTESYLRSLKKSGFIITKNKVSDNTMDIDIEVAKKVKFNIVYGFYEGEYYADIYDPQIYNDKLRDWDYVERNHPVFDRIMGICREIGVDKWRTEIKADF